jgi:hypothetical protein
MMKWKGFERKRLWLNFKVLNRNSPGETEENHEKLQSGKSVSGSRFEPWTPEYEAGV